MRRKAEIPPPEGFRYQTDILPIEEEHDLVKHIQELPLKEFEFHGYTGKRRVLSYGWHYDFEDRTLRPIDEIPPFLQQVRERAAAFASPHRKTCLTRLLPSTAAGPRSAGIAIKGCSTMWSGFLCSPPASFVYAGRPVPRGNATRKSWSRARLTCCAARRAPSGSTAFRPLSRSAIRSHSAVCARYGDRFVPQTALL